MSEQAVDKAHEIFDRAIRVPPEQRIDVVRAGCAGDGGLMMRVLAMLKEHEESLPTTVASPDTVAMPASGSGSRVSASATGRPGSGTGAPGPQLRIGDSLCRSRFRIATRVGMGGMGVVYKAEDVEQQRIVALKFPTLTQESSWEALERLRREVQAAREVVSPHVCQVYDLHLPGEDDPVRDPFISMEFVEGEDCRSVIRRFGRISGERTLTVAHELAEGLAAIHRKNILHRDLTPANVMLDSNGAVRILDFGIALRSTPEGSSGVRAAGNPHYLAPEIRNRTGEASIKSDIYSMGLVLFELFTGKRPPADPDGDAPTSLGNEGRHLHPDVATAILRCLSREPDERFASAEEFQANLPPPPTQRILRPDSIHVIAASDAVEPLKPMAISWLFAALLALAITVGLLLRPSDPQQPWTDRLPAVSADLRVPPAALAQLARTALPDKPSSGEEAHGFALAKSLEHPGRQDVSFWYRWHPTRLTAMNAADGLSDVDPPPGTPGTAFARLDPRDGSVIQAWWAGEGKPPAATAPTGVLNLRVGDALADKNASVVPLDVPKYLPIVPLSQRAVLQRATLSWGSPALTASYVVATVDGAVVYVDRLPAQANSAKPQATATTADKPEVSAALAPAPQSAQQTSLTMTISMLVFLIMLPLAILIARANVRRGRCDLRQAMRGAGLIFVLMFLSWVLTAGVRGPIETFFMRLRVGAGVSLFTAAMTWAYYVAIDPYARAIWKRSLVGYARVSTDWRSAGRDAVIGRSLLTGAAFGLVMLLLVRVSDALRVHTLDPVLSPMNAQLIAGWVDGAGWLGLALRQLAIALLVAMLYMVALILPYPLVRRTRGGAHVCAAVATLLLSLIYYNFYGRHAPGSPMDERWIGIGIFFVAGALTAYMLVREGVLAVATGLFFHSMLTTYPLSLSPASWTFGWSLAVIGTLLLIVLLGLRAATGGLRVPDLLAIGAPGR